MEPYNRGEAAECAIIDKSWGGTFGLCYESLYFRELISVFYSNMYEHINSLYEQCIFAQVFLNLL